TVSSDTISGVKSIPLNLGLLYKTIGHDTELETSLKKRIISDLDRGKYVSIIKTIPSTPKSSKKFICSIASVEVYAETPGTTGTLPFVEVITVSTISFFCSHERYCISPVLLNGLRQCTHLSIKSSTNLLRTSLLTLQVFKSIGLIKYGIIPSKFLWFIKASPLIYIYKF